MPPQQWPPSCYVQTAPTATSESGTSHIYPWLLRQSADVSERDHGLPFLGGAYP